MEIESLMLRDAGGARSLAIQGFQCPELQPDEIQIRPLYVGVCGTDIHLVQNQSSVPHRLDGRGLVLGHEAVAQIAKVGSAVRHLQAGDVVALESLVCCFRCSPCREGAFNQCDHAQLIGAQVNGLFAGLMNVPASVAHAVEMSGLSEADLRAYACLEPAAVAYLACESSRLRPGEEVLIFGGGPIGAYCAMFARQLFGAKKVYLREPLPFRRQIVAKYCRQVFDLEEDISFVRPDVVIEASGVLDHIDEFFPQIRPKGRVVLLARGGKSLQLKAVDHMITNAISIQGSRGHLGGAFQKLIGLQRSGVIRLEELVTSVLPSIEDLKSKLEEPGFFESQGKVLVKIHELR